MYHGANILLHSFTKLLLVKVFPYFLYFLDTCSSYKCSFIHPIFPETLEKGVIGESDGKCYSLEEMPNSGEQFCQYDPSQLMKMVNYYTFYEEQCGDGDCSITLNSTGYFINGLLSENILQEMYNNGHCVASFG